MPQTRGSTPSLPSLSVPAAPHQSLSVQRVGLGCHCSRVHSADRTPQGCALHLQHHLNLYLKVCPSFCNLKPTKETTNTAPEHTRPLRVASSSPQHLVQVTCYLQVLSPGTLMPWRALSPSGLSLHVSLLWAAPSGLPCPPLGHPPHAVPSSGHPVFLQPFTTEFCASGSQRWHWVWLGTCLALSMGVAPQDHPHPAPNTGAQTTLLDVWSH